MFLLIIIVILISSASILGNIYMGIFSLQQNYGDINNYYNSYYAAVSSIERGLLVTKYKQPSFVGSGGYIGEDNRGEISEIFSGDFGKFTEGDNGLVWEIYSQCNNITGILNNNQVLVLNSMSYSGTSNHYIYDQDLLGKPFNSGKIISGFMYNNINLISGNIHRQVNQWDGTGFIISSGETMIDYLAINYSGNLNFSGNTIDPSTISPVGNTLCSQTGCYSGTTISGFNINDKEILFYIKNRLIDTNDGQIGQIHYNLNINNNVTNCPFYYIDGNGIIGHYKNTLQIKKPAFNYKNPYRQNFIFPHYN